MVRAVQAASAALVVAAGQAAVPAATQAASLLPPEAAPVPAPPPCRSSWRRPLAGVGIATAAVERLGSGRAADPRDWTLHLAGNKTISSFCFGFFVTTYGSSQAGENVPILRWWRVV